MTCLTFGPEQCQVYSSAELLWKSAKQGARSLIRRSRQTQLQPHYFPSGRAGDSLSKALFQSMQVDGSLSLATVKRLELVESEKKSLIKPAVMISPNLDI